MKRNKGITLIALIVTIIVMLILVAVGVNVMIKSNLIGAAEKAANGYKTAYEDEINLIEEGENLIDDYIGGVEKKHNWQRSGDTITCEHCSLTYTIGEIVKDVYNYTPGTGTTTITSEKSGYTQNQTIILGDDPTQIVAWAVLGIEDRDKNGTKETLLLTRYSPTYDKITFVGATGYNNCVSEIDRMCKELFGAETEGITIEDINNCLQYTPLGGIYHNGTQDLSIGNFTTKLNELTTWNTIKGAGTKTPDGVNTEGALGNYPLTAYWYEKNSLSASTNSKNLIFGTDESPYMYWLASRGVYASTMAVFGAGSVMGGKAGTSTMLYNNSGGSTDRTMSLRPVLPIYP